MSWEGIGPAIIVQEVVMLKSKFLVIALPLAAAFTLAAASDAFAAKKMSYEQAWTTCKAQLDKTVPGDQASARHSAGASCMRSHGYRLKKGA